MELTDKIAIVTGGARGIGQATAECLAGRGATVVVADRDRAAAEDLARALRDGGARAAAYEVDVADEEAVAGVVDFTVQEFGGLNVMFANAARHRFQTVAESTPEDWDAVINVTLRGVYLCARAALLEMVPRGGGVIIATSSDCATRICRRSAAYVVAKAGVVGLMKSIAVDHGNDGIRANVVTPAVTDTPGHAVVYPSAEQAGGAIERAARASALGRAGRPADIAEAVAFLASERAAFITGANLMVDGGMTLASATD